VDYLLKNNLAEPSESPWASPCLLTPKPDKSFRMCTDYRKVNALTRLDSYPLPRIDDLIDAVGKSRFVTKIDLLKGYYQVPLTEQAKLISAFITPDGLYQYTVMPFGLTNAPATFQRLMNKIISGIKGTGVYIDDVVVHTDDWDEHVATLRMVFERIRQAQLTVNLVKSEIGHGRLVYLGFEVGGGQVAPVNAKVRCIDEMPVPTTIKEVQRFIGMAGYYRRFCPNFSQVAAPLTSLTSPKVKYKWSEDCQQSFEKIKALLTSQPVLQAPDFSKPFTIQVDASDAGIGAVLLQLGDDGILHPICYTSSKLKPYQQHYSTIEKEALALLTALDKFDVYVNNPCNCIHVFSDHNPLSFVNKMKNRNQRLTRWALALQPYNLSIHHISGKDNVIADFLSRK